MAFLINWGGPKQTGRATCVILTDDAILELSGEDKSLRPLRYFGDISDTRWDCIAGRRTENEAVDLVHQHTRQSKVRSSASGKMIRAYLEIVITHPYK